MASASLVFREVHHAGASVGAYDDGAVACGCSERVAPPGAEREEQREVGNDVAAEVMQWTEQHRFPFVAWLTCSR